MLLTTSLYVGVHLYPCVVQYSTYWERVVQSVCIVVLGVCAHVVYTVCMSC